MEGLRLPHPNALQIFPILKFASKTFVRTHMNHTVLYEKHIASIGVTSDGFERFAFFANSWIHGWTWGFSAGRTEAEKFVIYSLEARRASRE